MKKNNKKGFTLVELVIVVAVMAVLVAVAIPTVGSIVGTAKTSVAKSNARTIESVIKLEEAEQSNKGTTLGAAHVAQAVYEAKLGIDAEAGVVEFYYDSTTGSVKPLATGEGATNTGWKILFGSSAPASGATQQGAVQVTPTGEGATPSVYPTGTFTAYTPAS